MYIAIQLREMPTIPSSDGVEITLDNSRGTPIGEDHDDDTFAAIHGPLDTGDFDDQDANFVNFILHQVHSQEEPDLPPLPPPSPPLDRKKYPSTLQRLMDMMHDHEQKRRRTT
ncbi:hypothetical protein E4U58_005760 [Claviceps cyperi]|nr:hypothetical protein E4U58_005760 [Claviceps cyperi]